MFFSKYDLYTVYMDSEDHLGYVDTLVVGSFPACILGICFSLFMSL